MFGFQKIASKRKYKKKYKKIKNRFKANKLFLYVSSNSFHLFSFIMQRLNNFKIYKFQNNFNNIYLFIYLFL